METRTQKPVMLITGSTGLIGTRLVQEFSPEYTVVGLDRKRPERNIPGSEWVECDLTQDASTAAALGGIRERHGSRLASILHLAAYYDFSGEPSPLYQTLTVDGTRRLMQQLAHFQVEQFVYSSSLLVMKPSEEEEEIITETSPTEGAWDYPRSKLQVERVIARERGTIPSVILRIAGVYDEDCNSIPLAQHISRIYEKEFESYFFPGDADHGQPFVHLDDLTECFRRSVELRGSLEPLELFLIAEPDMMSYAELQDHLGEFIHGREWPTIRIPKAAAKAGAWVKEKVAGPEEAFIKPWMIELADADYPVAINRAQQRLGWRPRHRLRDTLGAMVERLKRDPKAWYRRNGLKPPEQEEHERDRQSA